MTVAFVVQLELEPSELSELTSIALEVTDALLDAGFEVAEVNPWGGETRESVPAPSPLASPLQPLSGSVPEIVLG